MKANLFNRDDGSEGPRVPLAMFDVECSSKKRLLFDVSSENVRGIRSTLFPDAFVEFENCGWLLMVRHKPFYFQEQIVFLIHPGTRRRIDLPVLHSPNKGYFVFYVDPRGTPLVVACVQIMSVVPTVHVACPGDVYWCVHKHTSNLIGTNRQHFDHGRSSDRDTGCLRRIPWAGPDLRHHRDDLENGFLSRVEPTRCTLPCCVRWRSCDCIVSSCDGKCFQVLQDGRSPLDGQELDDTSWFLCKGQSIRVKEEGKREVSIFDPRQCSGSVTDSSDGTMYFTGTSGPPTLKTIINIYAYELVVGTVETVIPASIVTEVRRWVQPSMFASPTK